MKYKTVEFNGRTIDVYEDGRIWKHEYIRADLGIQKGAWIKQFKNVKGYYRVSIAGKPLEVQTLVALAFHGVRPDGFDVHHKDENPENNHYTNLEYVTHCRNVFITAQRRAREKGLEVGVGSQTVGRYYAMAGRVSGAQKKLGTFNTIREAAEARDDYVFNVLGYDLDCLNFPERYDGTLAFD